MTKHQRREMARLESQLTEWRATNQRPTPIPAEIWKGAAKLSEQLSISEVARTLRLDYSKLKRLVDGAVLPMKSSQLATFVEFQPAQFTQGVGTLSCALEVESPGGGVMRARLDGVGPGDLGTVFRMFAS